MMSILKKSWMAALIFIFIACASAPKIVPGKGAVYGTVSAASHKSIIEKAAQNVDAEYSEDGKIVYSKLMVNYNQLQELYVCLIDPTYNGGKEHLLVAVDGGMSLRSIALAPGDKLRIRNNTPQTQNFFIAEVSGDEEGFQGIPPLRPGEEGVYTVDLEGDLELGSDDNEQLLTSIISKKGLMGRRFSSGAPYSFELLEPGQYDLIFWYWRLGLIQRQVDIRAGKNVQVNETLSVDRMVN
jgi:hypothetical protein